MTRNSAFLLLILGVVLGIIGTNLFSDSVKPGTSKEQVATDVVISAVDSRDSVVTILSEKVLYYEESFTALRAKFDSLENGVSVKVDSLSTLVHSDFDSLSDSVKLAYRERVLNRARRP